MKRIVVLCVLWLACARLIPEVNVSVARSRMSRTITGKVFDGETRLPVVAALTVNASGFSRIEAKSDSLGEFSISIPDATKCTIEVHAEGFDGVEETFEISESAKNYIEIPLTPTVKLTLDGTVFGGQTENEMPVDATLTVYINSDFIKADSIKVLNGRYTESFTNFGWYIVDFSAPGYENTTDTIWVMNTSRKTIHKDYHLVPLDSKIPTALNNIQFGLNRSELTADCFTELNYVAQFLKHNPAKRIEIAGHADSSGSNEYNLILSQARATAVVSYLTGRGVSADQFIIKAFGSQQPIDNNSTTSGRARNRRVELVITDKPFSDAIAGADFDKIRFDFGTTTLSPTYYAELDRLAELVNHNANARFEIAGHTDDTGPESYNLLLSSARAQAVVTYLQKRGVNMNHLSLKGYGAKKPIDSNSTPQGKANNRRVEIVALNQ